VIKVSLGQVILLSCHLYKVHPSMSSCVADSMAYHSSSLNAAGLGLRLGHLRIWDSVLARRSKSSASSTTEYKMDGGRPEGSRHSVEHAVSITSSQEVWLRRGERAVIKYRALLIGQEYHKVCRVRSAPMGGAIGAFLVEVLSQFVDPLRHNAGQLSGVSRFSCGMAVFHAAAMFGVSPGLFPALTQYTSAPS
jgi:hypothetical protein